jgi:3-dehydro-glucose-6-phosphate--glutamate transaminase
MDQANNNAAGELAGDSRSLVRLVDDIVAHGRVERPIRACLANQRLIEAVTGAPAQDPPDRPADRPRGRRIAAPEDLLATERPPSPTSRVRFLPMDALMSAEEKQGALRAFAEVVATGEFTSGPHTGRFEAEVSAFLGQHVVATSSGTDGMLIALTALGVGHGAEVIMPSNSFVATENAVLAAGAAPVLADVRAGDYNLDPAQIERHITPRTRAILPVHLYGKVADLAAMRAVADAHGLVIVVDACQAIGATGALDHADASVLSFNPYKNFGVCGKGGAVVTASAALAKTCLSVTYHGYVPGTKAFKQCAFGFNSRIDNTQAAIGLARLPHLTFNNLRRLILARRYIRELKDLVDRERILISRYTEDNAYHLFPVQVLGSRPRDEIRAELELERGIETGIYYPVLTHKQTTAVHRRLFGDVELPVTEAAHERLFHLPLYNTLTQAEQDRVLEALHAVLA